MLRDKPERNLDISRNVYFQTRLIAYSVGIDVFGHELDALNSKVKFSF